MPDKGIHNNTSRKINHAKVLLLDKAKEGANNPKSRLLMKKADSDYKQNRTPEIVQHRRNHSIIGNGMLDEGVPMLKTEEGSKFATVNLRFTNQMIMPRK